MNRMEQHADDDQPDLVRRRTPAPVIVAAAAMPSGPVAARAEETQLAGAISAISRVVDDPPGAASMRRDTNQEERARDAQQAAGEDQRGKAGHLQMCRG